VEGGPRVDEHKQPGGGDMCGYEAELLGMSIFFFVN
jgi:hypothetical protein